MERRHEGTRETTGEKTESWQPHLDPPDYLTMSLSCLNNDFGHSTRSHFHIPMKYIKTVTDLCTFRNAFSLM